jgi:antitoxin VapB
MPRSQEVSAVLQLSPETEALARRLAAAQGLSVEQAVRLAMRAVAGAEPAGAPKPQLPREELLKRMEEISVRSGARPLIDPRSPDELLGYDDYGLPQ